MTDMAKRLREILSGPEMVVAPFVFDAFQAKIAEAAGFQAVYMTGFGTAAARGYPDVGLLTMAEQGGLRPLWGTCPPSRCAPGYGDGEEIHRLGRQPGVRGQGS